MKAISKIIVYANKYKDWEISLGTGSHPPYSASGYYKGIMAELLIIQGGVCAYTEKRLVEESELDYYKKSFKDGEFNGEIKRMPIDLEHFDSRLKENFGWKWSNFFAVDSNINQKEKRIEENKLIKAGKSVHDLMKPDLDGYDPLTLLDYEPYSNMVISNTKLSISKKTQVDEMIICLGLNNGSIKTSRKRYFAELKFREKTGEVVTPDQFLTSWEIINNQ